MVQGSFGGLGGECVMGADWVNTKPGDGSMLKPMVGRFSFELKSNSPQSKGTPTSPPGHPTRRVSLFFPAAGGMKNAGTSTTRLARRHPASLMPTWEAATSVVLEFLERSGSCDSKRFPGAVFP